MAEFQEVIEGAKRMCWHYTQNGSHNGCPMYPACNVSQCRKIAFERPAEFEQRVMQWAAENPEPVYPSWKEYLESIGVIVPHKNYTVMDTYSLIISQINNTRISADIAQKLGIEPKEVER